MTAHQLRVGFNLDIVGGTSTQQPFLNLVKQAPVIAGPTGFSGILNNDRMNVNSNGFPTNLTVANPANGDSFTSIAFAVLNGVPYPSTGKYIFLYNEGNGCVLPGGGSTDLINDTGSNGYNAGTTSGRIVYHSNGAGNGLRITFSNLGSPAAKDWKLVWEPNPIGTALGAAYDPTGARPSYVGDREWSLMHDQAFLNPDFVDRLNGHNFFALRFMQFGNDTNGNSQTSFSQISPANWWSWCDGVTYPSGGGNALVPHVVMVGICNATNTNCWMNIPSDYTDACVQSIAAVMHNGTTDGDGRVWPGLNSNLLVYTEGGNENWHATALGHNIFPGATLGSQEYPSMNPYGTFTGTIDNGAGGSGNTFTLTAVLTGALNTSNYNENFLTGTGVTAGTYITGIISGTPGAAGSTYSVSQNSNTGSITVKSSSTFAYWYQHMIRRQIQDAYFFRTEFGSSRVKGVLAGQFTGNNPYILDSLPDDFGGAATWDGTHGGTAHSNMDFFTVAPYFGPYFTPVAWTDSATDPGQALFFQEITNGSVMPGGGSPITATAVGGAPLVNGWTTAAIVSGQSLPSTPANGTVICARFPAGARSDLSGAPFPTIAADGGTQFPFFTNNFTMVQDTIWENQSSDLVVNLIFTSATGAGANAGRWCKLPPGGAPISSVVPNLTITHTQCVARGIPLIYYEGGQQFYAASQATWSNYYNAANRSQKMYTAYMYWLNALETSGFGNLIMHYTFAVPFETVPGNSGDFGSMEYINQTPNSPKYQALLDWAAESGGGGTGAAPAHGFQSGRVKGQRRQIPHV